MQHLEGQAGFELALREAEHFDLALADLEYVAGLLANLIDHEAGVVLQWRLTMADRLRLVGRRTLLGRVHFKVSVYPVGRGVRVGSCA